MLVSAHFLTIRSIFVSYPGVNWLVFRKTTKPFDDFKKEKKYMNNDIILMLLLHKILLIFSFLPSHSMSKTVSYLSICTHTYCFLPVSVDEILRGKPLNCFFK